MAGVSNLVFYLIGACIDHFGRFPLELIAKIPRNGRQGKNVHVISLKNDKHEQVQREEN